MFLLMLPRGLRIERVSGLQLTGLFLDEEYPRIVARGNGSGEPSVYLSRPAEIVLREHLMEGPPDASAFVFLSYLEDGLSTTVMHNCLLKYPQMTEMQNPGHRFLLYYFDSPPLGRCLSKMS